MLRQQLRVLIFQRNQFSNPFVFSSAPYRVSGLGYVPQSARTVKPVPAWALALVPRPTGKNETIKASNEDVEQDTMPLIKNKIQRTLHHTKKLAPKLKGTTLEQTLRNNWNFIFDHIRYVKDAPGKEQVRSPRRMIHEGKGDCDCFTVTLSSLLHNQGIPHKLRIMKQNGKPNWSHIYVIVPKAGGGHYTLDPVTHRFNYEAPNTETKDYPMALEYLDGLATDVVADRKRCPRMGAEALSTYVPVQYIQQDGLIPTQKFLQDNAIPFTAEGGNVMVPTSKGNVSVPATLTPTQASLVKNALIQQDAEPIEVVEAEVLPNEAEQPTVQMAGFGWLIVLLIGGALLTMKDPKKAAGKAATGGMAGVRKKSKRLKTLKL